MSKLKEYKFDELYQMDSGISTSKFQAGHGAPFVSFKDIYNNPILPDILTEKMDTSEEEQKRYSVKKGDIFLTRTSEVINELAMSSVAVKDYPCATFSGFAKRLRPLQDDITYDKFMAFYLRSAYFRKVIDAKAVMTLRASFNKEIFSYINLLLPDYDTQVKIGDLFYQIECKIRNNNKISSELESMAKTIYDYWFLQFDFPDENGKPYKSSGGKMVWNEELKRDIPEGWTIKKIQDILASIPITKKYKSDEYGKGNKYPIIDQSLKYICGYTDNENDLLNLESCIVFGDHTKHVKYVNFAFARGADGTQIINSAVNNVPNYILYRQILSMDLVSQGYSRYFKFLKDKYVIVPHEKVSDNFMKSINDSLDKMKHIISENKELEDLRDFLLPLLMNGQVGFKEQ
ncbi:MAG: restriction endonuclease subunit S [Muribaculaceae bacterium]|nr:restriction endonuclease subunit S [Muribaculaceae bacterium]